MENISKSTVFCIAANTDTPVPLVTELFYQNCFIAEITFD